MAWHMRRDKRKFAGNMRKALARASVFRNCPGTSKEKTKQRGLGVLQGSTRGWFARNASTTALTAIMLAATASQGVAQTTSYGGFTFGPPPGPERPFYEPSELRGGFGVSDPTTDHETSAIVSGQLLFQPLFSPGDFFLLRPRPHVGADVNFEGLTSKLYLGVTWDIVQYQDVFFEIDFGFAVHDGVLERADNPNDDRKRLGSRWEFREAVALGYRFSPQYNVSAYIDHISNAGWFDETNQGLETAGIRFGVSF